MPAALPLIGREAELAALATARARAAAGRGGVVCLVGEAGIGKSTITAVFEEEARAGGFAVSVGRAWELGEAPPFFPLWPALRSLGLAVPPPPLPAGPFLYWQEVLAALAAAPGPRAWVIEDLHAADSATVELLLFLAATARSLPFLVLVTTRPREERRLDRLRREAVQLPLGPLPPPEATRLARRLRPGLDEAAARALVDRVGGNPLWLEAVARADGAEGPLGELVAARVAHLPAATREALDAAAVLGRELRAGPLSRMLGVMPAVAIDLVAPALRDGLLAELAPGHWRFAHAALAEGLRERLPAAARAALHRRAAEALGPAADPAARLARAGHLVSALGQGGGGIGEAEEVEELVRWLVAQGAPDRAWDLARSLVAARAQGWAPDRGVAGLVEAAEVAAAGGAFSEAQGLAEAAVRRARAERDPVALGRAALALGRRITPGHVDTGLVRVLEEAEVALEGGREAAAGPLRERVRARLAAARQPARDSEVQVALARAAVVALPALPGEHHGEVLENAGAALSDFVPHLELRAHAEALRAWALRHGDEARLLRALERLALAALSTGDVPAFDEAVDAALAASRAARRADLLGRPLLLGSMRALARGDLDESDRLCTEVERLAALTDDLSLQRSFAAHRFQRLTLLGPAPELRGALAFITGSIGASPFQAQIAAFVAGVAAARLGDAAGAAAALERLPLAHVLRHPWSDSYGCAAEIWAVAAGGAALDEPRRALLGLLGPRREGFLTSGFIPLTCEGPTRRVTGLLLAALGRREEAEAELEAARTQAAAAGFRPWVGRLAEELDRLRSGGAARGAGTAPTLPGPTSATALAAVAPPSPLQMHRDGEDWTFSRGGRSLRIRGGRGLDLLHRLVARPGEEIHVLALSSDAEGELRDSSAGPALDARATRAYRLRVEQIAEILARGEGDEAALLAERRFLERELARAGGLGGATREAGSLAERARVNVQRRLKDAIGRVAERDAELGRYLGQAVRTGTWCSFRP